MLDNSYSVESNSGYFSVRPGESEDFAAVFVPGVGTDGLGRIVNTETSTIDLVSEKLNETGITTAYVNLGIPVLPGGYNNISSVQKMADRLAEASELLSKAGYKKKLFIAQSLGCAIASEYISSSDISIEGLHLWAPPTFEDFDHSKRISSAISGEGGESMLEDDSYHSRGGYRLSISDHYWQGIERTNTRSNIKDSRSRIGNLHLFTGSEDELYPAADYYYRDVMRPEEVTILEGYSHTFRFERMRRKLISKTISLTRQLLTSS